MRRIGIDVGGTNTDAVLVEDERVVTAVKTPTTPERTEGVSNALSELLNKAGDSARLAAAVMVGTTRFVNAVVERKDLNPVAALRICLPASASLVPFVDWPSDLATKVNAGHYLVAGGHEVDGRPLADLDEAAIAKAARDMRRAEVPAVAVSAVFSPLTVACEDRAAEIIRSEYPEIRITKSSALGRIGLLERENATLLNASLLHLAARVVATLEEAVRRTGLGCPLFVTQNDGTLASAALATEFPIFSFASGPTNSMRGGAFLSGLDDAMVCDIGGTTTDIGCLRNGFPREANNVIRVGGVRTLFRMPDLFSMGLGGGSLVKSNPLAVGPASVGFELGSKALVFGGDTLTATDIAVASGAAEIGDRRRVAHLGKRFVTAARQSIHEQLIRAADRMKPDATPIPLLAVGGGALLAPPTIPGISEVIRVEHSDVANAVGAAIAQISGEVDQVFQDMSREAVLETATEIARQKAVASGADPASLKIVEREDIPLSYLPGQALRARVKVVGAMQQL